jgi:hypothetical protein
VFTLLQAIAAAQAIATRMASQGSARPLPAAPSPGAYNAATGTYNSMHQARTYSHRYLETCPVLWRKFLNLKPAKAAESPVVSLESCAPFVNRPEDDRKYCCSNRKLSNCAPVSPAELFPELGITGHIMTFVEDCVVTM